MKAYYTDLAIKITKLPYMARILDKANHDHDAFRMWLSDVLRAERVGDLPESVIEALNSGDGAYRP